MSSRTPTECVELATDDSASKVDRTEAIHALKRANECDELEALVRSNNLDEQYRREALHGLATSQCSATLQKLVNDDSFEEYRDEAIELFHELSDEY